MALALKRSHAQFRLRSLLAGVTWAALVIAICVGQQQAASRQRQVIERLKASGVLPPTTIGGRPLPPSLPQQQPVLESTEHSADR